MKLLKQKKRREPLKQLSRALKLTLNSTVLLLKKENNLTSLTKANSFRVKVRQEKETLSSLENTLVKSNEERKQI